MMKKLTIILSVFILFIAACKKSGDGGGSKTFTGCELVKVVDSSDAKSINIKTTVSYDVTGNFIGAANTGTSTLSRSVDYINPLVPILRISGAGPAETDTISLQNGMISTIAAHYYTTPWTNKISYFTYDANGQLTTRKDFYSNGTFNTYTYTWSNGDLVSEMSGVDSFIYTYDTSMLSQDGDWMREYQIVTLGLGRTYINNKHVVASRRHNMDAPTYFFYLKDDLGRISTCNTYTGSSLEVYTYSYYCTQ